MSTETRLPAPATASDWEIHSHQDKELVKGLGLTSATTLVMGSMIGSGHLYCFRGDCARGAVSSPADWRMGGHGHHDHHRRAELWRACRHDATGRRSVRLFARSAGPLWGFLYGWTLFLVIQTGTVAAVGVAFGKFLGIFFPSISSSRWIVHLWKVPPIHVGPMVLGNMDVGLNTQNLVAHHCCGSAFLVNIFGVKTGALIQNIFTIAKASALFGLSCWELCSRAQRAGAGGELWRKFLAQRRLGQPLQVGSAEPMCWSEPLTILAVAQVGSLFSADAWNNVTFTAGEVKNPSRNLPLSLAIGHRHRSSALYIACNFIYLNVLPLVGRPHGTTILERGIQYAAEDRVGTAVMAQMFSTTGGKLDGGRHH